MCFYFILTVQILQKKLVYKKSLEKIVQLPLSDLWKNRLMHKRVYLLYYFAMCMLFAIFLIF